VLTGLVAAALVLVVGLGGWVAALRGNQQNQQVATLEVNELLTAPDAKVYATTMNGAPVSFVVSKERDQALFLGDNVPSPGDGKVYQLWMIGAEITPNALVDRGGDITQWMDDGPLQDAKQLAVTIEPAGGSTTPTLPPVAGVEL
jgi:anti-sigma-K factor RskA